MGSVWSNTMCCFDARTQKPIICVREARPSDYFSYEYRPSAHHIHSPEAHEASTTMGAFYGDIGQNELD